MGPGAFAESLRTSAANYKLRVFAEIMRGRMLSSGYTRPQYGEGCGPRGERALSASVDEQNSGATYRSEDLLPIMYHELKSLARARLRGDAGHTLQPTALVHEAYLRLTRGVATHDAAVWNGPGHFFGAAAEAMRQVLVDHARGKHAIKRGGEFRRVAMSAEAIESATAESDASAEHVLLVNQAVDALAEEDPLLADILKLRYFAGLSREETAAALDLSPRTLDRRWRYIVAVLRAREASQD